MAYRFGNQALSVLSCCLSRRIPSLSSWRQWANLTWGRVSVMLVLLDSCVAQSISIRFYLTFRQSQLALCIFRSVICPLESSSSLLVGLKHSRCVSEWGGFVIFTHYLRTGHIYLYQLLCSKQGGMCRLICCLHPADVVLKTDVVLKIGSHLWVSGREGIQYNIPQTSY